MTEKNILSEQESKKLITKIICCMPNSAVYNDIDTFLTLLYDKGYVVAKREKEKIEPQ